MRDAQMLGMRVGYDWGRMLKFARVADFEGAVLLKGSRANALETLVPEWAIDEENADHARC